MRFKSSIRIDNFFYIIICVYKTKPYSIPTKFSDVHANCHFNHSTTGGGGEGVYGIYGGICDIWNPPDVFASYGLVKLMSCLYVNLCGRV